MISIQGTIFEAVTGVAAVAGIAFYSACLWSARDYMKQRSRSLDSNSFPVGDQPPVSILKPLKGDDPEMYQSFRSHCLQEYPQFEIIFGVSDPNDPAVGSVERLQKEFPGTAIGLVVSRENLGANPKVSNLAQMAVSYTHLTLPTICSV